MLKSLVSNRPSEVCPDAAKDPCITVNEALQSPTFRDAYEDAKQKIAAVEEE